MPAIKQRTIDGETHYLYRYATDRPGKQHEYYIQVEGSNQRVDDETYYAKDRAMDAWREHIRLVQRGAGAERQDARGLGTPAFGGGGNADGDRTPFF